jgi:hypothetical protein
MWGAILLKSPLHRAAYKSHAAIVHHVVDESSVFACRLEQLLYRAGAQPAPAHHQLSPLPPADVGWGETYLQYFWGTGPYGPQFRNATKIFSLVIEGLLENPARRFSYVEQAFFQLF